MKQYNVANELFDSCKQVKKIFSADMTALVNGKSVSNTPSDYVLLLQKFYKILNLLGIQSDQTETSLSNLETLCRHMESQEESMAFINLYYESINDILLHVIIYRENFCIIKRSDPIPGLGSHIITNIGQIAASLSEGYIPIIDMQTTENSFHRLSQQSRRNAWELFFKQPCGIPLSGEVFQHNYIVKDGIPSFMPSYNMDFLTNPVQIHFWQKLMKTYMPFSSVVEEKIEIAHHNVPFHTNKRILGILCRGTDYIAMRPYNHPVQPTMNEILTKAEEVLRSYQCSYIYLATEDVDILSAFKNRFPDIVFTTQDIYYPAANGSIFMSLAEQEPDAFYKKNEEYLIALYLLSRCHCLIGGRTSGIVVSVLLSEQYDYFYVWNKGRYGIDDVFCDLFIPPYFRSDTP